MSIKAYGTVTVINVDDGINGQKGDTGVGVQSVTPMYCLSSSTISIAGNKPWTEWSEDKPAIDTTRPEKYLWVKQRTRFTDGTFQDSSAKYDATITGIESRVSQTEQNIINKVWQTDITNTINEYDNTTTSAIRDRVTNVEQDISGITSTVSDLSTTVHDNNTTITNRVATIEQDASGLRTTVSGVITNANYQNVYIIGTQTATTNVWTGRTDKITSLADGQQITYWLPFAGNSSSATLNLTLVDSEGHTSTTGAVPCYYGGTSRITNQYGAGNAVRLTYRTNVTIGTTTIAKGWWADANYNSNTYDRTRYNAAVYAKTALVKGHLAVGDATGFQQLNTGNPFNIDYPILYISTAINASATGTDTYIVMPMAVSPTQTLTLTPYKSLYIKGTLSGRIFTPVSTSPITQTEPTSEDGYIYIYLGQAYNTTNFYLLAEHPIYMFKNGTFAKVETSALTIAEQTADGFNWLVEKDSQSSSYEITSNGIQAITDKFIIKDNNGSATIISGGQIHANAITTAMLATDAIKSTNYSKTGGNVSAYSTTGSYFNLSTGNIETPNFAVDNTNGKAYINGEVIATSGSIGNSINNYWEIGTKTDYNASQSAAIIAHGSSYIQSGQFMIHDDKVNTQSYDSNRKITYPKYSNVYYDYGMQAPQLNTSASGYIAGISDLFLYARKHTSTIPVMESDWEYVFKVDKDGTIYENGVKLSEKYASISGVDGTYLPLTGGTISGNLTVQGTLTATSSKAIADKNGLDISTAYLKLAGGTVTGDLIVSKSSGFNYSGIQTATSNTNRYIWFGESSSNKGRPVYNTNFTYNPSTNTLTVGTVNGNASTATTATKALQDEDGNVIKTTYIKTTGGTISGAIIINAELQADSINVGNLVVNGVARFNNDLYGNLTGNVTGSASKLAVSAGSATQPIYFDNGIPVATTYALNKTVPSNAVFTDTNWYHTTGSWSGLTYTAAKSNSSMGALAFTIPTGTSSTTVAVGNHTHTNYASKITLAGTDYSVSNNTIVISQANLQSAVQSTDYVLMTTAERSKLSSIEVTEGGTIDFSGVTASAPLSATVNSSTGAVNIAHNTSGVSAGTYRSITVNTYGHVTAGTNPTTLSGYGITDAKIANGVITLGSNTITPLTASSTLNATKLSGTASIDTTGNASTATKATQDGDGNTISSTYLKLSGGTLTNHLLLSKAGEIGVKVTNTSASHEVDLIVSSTGGGIYDRTFSKWIVNSDSNGNVQLNGNALTATTATSANSATRATQDGNGNVITSTYLPLSGGTVTGTLVLSKVADLSGLQNNNPALIIGGTATQPHMEIDNNEIQCKDSATTTKALYINLDGGSVNVGEGGFVSRGNVTVGSHARLSYNSTYQCLQFSFI